MVFSIDSAATTELVDQLHDVGIRRRSIRRAGVSAATGAADMEVARAGRARRGVPARDGCRGADRGAAGGDADGAGGGRRSGLHARPGRQVDRPRLRRVTRRGARARGSQGGHREDRAPRRGAARDRGASSGRGRCGDRVSSRGRLAVPARARARRPRRADAAPAPHGMGRSRLGEPPRVALARRARPADARSGRGSCAGISPSQETGERRSDMQETAKIWMNGELVDWADATVHVGCPRSPLRHRGLRGDPRLRDAEGPGGVPSRRPHAAAPRQRAPPLHGSAVLRRGAARGDARPRSRQRAPCRVHPPDRVLRLRLARRPHAREPGRDGHHELAVGRVPRRGLAHEGHHREGLVLEARRPERDPARVSKATGST